MSDDFEELGIAVQFPIDLTVLDRAYRELQMRYHPDQFLLENERTQQEATLKAAAINEAYRRLRDPIFAAEAYFARQFDVSYLGQVFGQPAFLDHLLTVGENMDLAEQAKDIDALHQLTTMLRREIDDNYHQLLEHFQQKEKEAAAINITHWKYLKKTLDRLEDKIDDLAVHL